MIIHSLAVSGLRPYADSPPIVKNFRTYFSPRGNVIIGPNGCGKTHLLMLIAVLTGTDEAERLLDSYTVDECTIEMHDGGELRRLSITGKIAHNLREIANFKNTLSERVNFPITDFGPVYASRVIPVRDAKDMLCDLVGEDAVLRMMRFHKAGVHDWSGNGMKRMVELVFGDGASGVPTIMDNPERHLDVTNQRRMERHFLDQAHDHQIIYATHSPFLLGSHNHYRVIDMGSKKLEKSA